MGKPILNRVSTFDATNAYTFSFTYIGNQPYKNRLVIIDTSNSTTVINNTITEMRYIHNLAVGSLTNGHSYSVQIAVIDEFNVESSLSDKVFFTCYATPSFSFSGLSTESQNNISSGLLQTTILYSQDQSRALRSYQFYLYNATKSTIIDKSGTINYSSGSDISYTFKSLENETLYYIRCTGETVDGVSIDTGYAAIFSSYSTTNSFSSLTLTNSETGGYVQCSAKVISVEGVSDGDYTLENSILSLHNASVKYSDGFILNGWYKICLTVLNPNKNEEIYRHCNGKGCLSIIHGINPADNKHFIKLTAINESYKNIIYSNMFDLEEDVSITIYVTHQDNLYGLNVVTE